MRCAECGTEIPDSARHGKPQKFCSSKCRLRAWRREQKSNDTSEPKRPPTKAGQKRRSRKIAVSAAAVQTQPETPTEAEPYDVLLKRTQNRLQTAMFDPRTPSTSLSALSKQLLTVTKELESLTGGNEPQVPITMTEVVDDAFDSEVI